MATMRGCAWRLGGMVRTHARCWLPIALQSRRCVYPVKLTDGALLSRVMSELAPVTLGRDKSTSDLSGYHARLLFFSD